MQSRGVGYSLNSFFDDLFGSKVAQPKPNLGQRPFHPSYYQSFRSPALGTIYEPRNTINSKKIPSLYPIQPSNTVAVLDKHQSILEHSWYWEAYNRRKRRADTALTDPNDYLSGRNLPLRQGTRIRDIGTGTETHTLTPGLVVKSGLLHSAKFDNTQRERELRTYQGRGVTVYVGNKPALYNQ
jgi:hypothetical protein